MFLLPSIHIVTYAVSADGLSADQLEGLKAEKALDTYRRKSRDQTYQEFTGGQSMADDLETNQESVDNFMKHLAFEDNENHSIEKQAVVRIDSTLLNIIKNGHAKAVSGDIILPKSYARQVEISSLDTNEANYDHCLTVAHKIFRRNNRSDYLVGMDALELKNENVILFHRVAGYVNGSNVNISDAGDTFWNIRNHPYNFAPSIDLSEHIDDRAVNPAKIFAGQKVPIMGFTSAPPNPENKLKK